MISKVYKLDQLKGSGWLANIGLILILVAMFISLPEHISITARTILASFGSALILIFAQAKSFAKRLLSNRIMVLIGLISYSVYLYHQPLLTLTRIYVTDEPGLIIIIPIILTFVFAAISYHIIECPFRDKSRISTSLAMSVFTFIGIILISIGVPIHAKSGFPQRAEVTETNNYKESIAYNQRAFDFLLDQFPEKSGTKTLVIGNSFGRDTVSVLLESIPVENINLIYRNNHYDCFHHNKDPNISILDRIVENNQIPITDSLGRVLSPDRTHLTRAGAEFLTSTVLNRTQLCKHLKGKDCINNSPLYFDL